MPEPYWTDGERTIIHGDNAEVLPLLEAEFIHAVCTDPPYGWGFMLGSSPSKWDANLPDPAVYRELLRVLKPGGFLLNFCGPRLDCLWRMARMIEEAGFDIGYSPILWVYATGFPKGCDVGKAIDKAEGAERAASGSYMAPRQAERGTMRDEWPTSAGGYSSSAFLSDPVNKPQLTAPATSLAAQWDGWKTGHQALKPACEVIVVAQKPMEQGAQWRNLVKHGVGGFNVKGAAVPWPKGEAELNESTTHPNTGVSGYLGVPVQTGAYVAGPGRYPSNLVVSGEALGPELSRYWSVDRFYATRFGTTDTSQDCGAGCAGSAAASADRSTSDRDLMLQSVALLRTPHTVDQGLARAYCASLFGRSSWPVDESTTHAGSTGSRAQERDVAGLRRILGTGSREGERACRGSHRSCPLGSEGERDPGSTGSTGSRAGCQLYRRLGDALLRWASGADQAPRLLLGGALEVCRLPEPSGDPLPDDQRTGSCPSETLLALVEWMLRFHYCTTQKRESQPEGPMAQWAKKHVTECEDGLVAYCPKAGRREKDEGLGEDFSLGHTAVTPTSPNSVLRCADCGRTHPAGDNGKRQECKRCGSVNLSLSAAAMDGTGRSGGPPARCSHPTCKPLALVAWLLTLVCPSDGTILDPFMGSGTTLVAAKQLGLRAIGIELNDSEEEPYCRIAQKRTEAAKVPERTLFQEAAGS